MKSLKKENINTLKQALEEYLKNIKNLEMDLFQKIASLYNQEPSETRKLGLKKNTKLFIKHRTRPTMRRIESLLKCIESNPQSKDIPVLTEEIIWKSFPIIHLPDTIEANQTTHKITEEPSDPWQPKSLPTS